MNQINSGVSNHSMFYSCEEELSEHSQVGDLSMSAASAKTQKTRPKKTHWTRVFTLGPQGINESAVFSFEDDQQAMLANYLDRQEDDLLQLEPEFDPKAFNLENRPLTKEKY